MKGLYSQTSTFLNTEEQNEFERSLFWMNFYLNGAGESFKPYTIDYNTLLVSFHTWQGENIELFCLDQTVAYFLLNPQMDSKAAREAFFQEIHEFFLAR